MDASTKDNFSIRLDAVIQEARTRVKEYQTKAAKEHPVVRERFQKFLPIAEQITAMARAKLERLRERLEFEVRPNHTQTERLYVRSVVIEVKTEQATVVKLGFSLTHDSEVRQILLDYDLEIIPAFFRFNPHSRLEIPIELYDDLSVSAWLDDRLVDFANSYLELHLTKQYQEQVLVPDPVAGISFPKYFAASTLDHEGATYYFISEETGREFEIQHGLTS